MTSESEIAKMLIRIIKKADEFVQRIQEDIAKAKEIQEELKKLKEKGYPHEKE